MSDDLTGGQCPPINATDAERIKVALLANMGASSPESMARQMIQAFALIDAATTPDGKEPA